MQASAHRLQKSHSHSGLQGGQHSEACALAHLPLCPHPQRSSRLRTPSGANKRGGCQSGSWPKVSFTASEQTGRSDGVSVPHAHVNTGCRPTYENFPRHYLKHPYFGPDSGLNISVKLKASSWINFLGTGHTTNDCVCQSTGHGVTVLYRTAVAPTRELLALASRSTLLAS